MSDAGRGLVFDTGTLTLGQYLDRWLPNIKDTVRQRTWERYEQLVRVHIKPALGSKKLKDLTRTYLKALYRENLDAGLAPRTAQYIRVTLHKALKDSVGTDSRQRMWLMGSNLPSLRRRRLTRLPQSRPRPPQGC